MFYDIKSLQTLIFEEYKDNRRKTIRSTLNITEHFFTTYSVFIIGRSYALYLDFATHDFFGIDFSQFVQYIVKYSTMCTQYVIVCICILYKLAKIQLIHQPKAKLHKFRIMYYCENCM